MTEIKPPMMTLKPTLETRFFIDPVWWEQSDHDLNSTITQIAAEFSVTLPDSGETDLDWIDPDTAIVTRVDKAFFTFLKQVVSRSDYITERTPMIDAIFRALLGNARRPLSVDEIANRAKRPAAGVLQLLSGKTIYKGIRRYSPENDR